jgi:CRP-like cAMP-binding protein
MLFAGHQQLIEILQSWVDIPLEQRAAIAGIFHPAQVERDAVLLHAGEYPHTLAFIVSGLLRLYYIDANGNEYTKSFCMENDIVSAYSALLLNEPSRLCIQALEPSSLLVADFQSYQRITTQHSCWQIVNRKIAEALFIKKEKREASLLLDDAQTRYLAFLAEYPHLEGRVKQHHIASYLGITPVSLSRIRARLPHLILR